MDKPDLIRRFTQLVDEMERSHAWGKIEVSFQHGQAETIRKETTEKLNKGATHYNDQKEYR